MAQPQVVVQAGAALSHFERARTRTRATFVEIFSKLVEDLPKPEDDALKRAFYRACYGCCSTGACRWSRFTTWKT